MNLYLRANRITGAEDKVTAVLSRLCGGTAEAFAQQKLDEIDEQDNTPSRNAFEAEIRLVYQDKTREADTEWRIETFIQCYNLGLLTRSNCDRNSRQPCIFSSPLTRGSN